MSGLGVVGVGSLAVTIIAVENVTKGHDPFPQLLVGGMFIGGATVISEVNEGLGMGIVVLFLVSTLLLHSDGVLGVISGVSKTPKTPGTDFAGGKVPGPSATLVSPPGQFQPHIIH